MRRSSTVVHESNGLHGMCRTNGSRRMELISVRRIRGSNVTSHNSSVRRPWSYTDELFMLTPKAMTLSGWKHCCAQTVLRLVSQKLQVRIEMEAEPTIGKKEPCGNRTATQLPATTAAFVPFASKWYLFNRHQSYNPATRV